MKEDARQPPYLCPVCVAKLGWAVCVELRGSGKATPMTERKVKEWEKKRYGLMSEFCAEKRRECVAMWKGLGAWAEGVLADKRAWTEMVQEGGSLRTRDKGYP
jgi:archaemetzincin